MGKECAFWDEQPMYRQVVFAWSKVLRLIIAAL
jgi:hypothetical protein